MPSVETTGKRGHTLAINIFATGQFDHFVEKTVVAGDVHVYKSPAALYAVDGDHYPGPFAAGGFFTDPIQTRLDIIGDLAALSLHAANAGN